jgi:lysophospholipase L1-like esterase
MKIGEKLLQKAKNIRPEESITIAFLGDSVTQGCFDVYVTQERNLGTVFEPTCAFSNRLREIMAILYPAVQINIINSGISGDSAKGGLERLERDVLRFSPDLTVISYGLNDCSGGVACIPGYIANLEKIIKQVKENGSEIIFLTQNFYNTGISPYLKTEQELKLAKQFYALQHEGVLKTAFEQAKELCLREGVRVCDLYSVWEKLYVHGVNTTELLSNKLNHPTREFHYYMAIKLIETMLEI